MIDPLYDAARRIDDLTAERDRLRAALEEIIQELGRGGDAADIHAVIIARRALGEGK